MVLTPSTMMALGTKAPDFELLNVVSGKKESLLAAKKDKGLVVMFICKHCPYVKHIEIELARFGRDYAAKEIGIVAVSSNDAANYPEDHPAQLKEMARTLSFSFPFLYDESQAAAKAYRAACTPDFFIFDGDLKLVYRGQFDDSRPKNTVPVTGKDLRVATDALLAGDAISGEQKPSLGCNIKWRPGFEPDYFK
ncbi:MAG TPA: thioredoxin family protein [Candidatus Omnitrophica bacterium]|nr:thioredoxin family protein [Candidatus Omnitrophota bacterium]